MYSYFWRICFLWNITDGNKTCGLSSSDVSNLCTTALSEHITSARAPQNARYSDTETLGPGKRGCRRAVTIRRWATGQLVGPSRSGWVDNAKKCSDGELPWFVAVAAAGSLNKLLTAKPAAAGSVYELPSVGFVFSHKTCSIARSPMR